MPEKIRRQLPIGIGGEKLKEGRETLPAVEVENEVSFVNNKINLPFDDLKVGKPSKLGMFLQPDPESGEKIYGLEVSGSHTRSGILGRIIFKDKEGRLYRDVDLKGMGYVDDLYYMSKIHTVGKIRGSYGKASGESSLFSEFRGTTGIANQELIRRDLNFSEKFLKAGVRTHRVVAIIDLKEIIDSDGKKVSIEEAKKRNMLSQEDEPVIEVRAYGTRFRLFDLYRALNRNEDELALKLLSDAKNIVAQELNIDLEGFTNQDYFKWFLKTMAVNVARMHYNGWVSGYLTEHNITLDGRIVDLDSVETEAEARTGQHKGVHDELKTFDLDRRQVIDSFDTLLLPSNSFNFDKTTLTSYFYQFYSKELERLKKEKVIKVKN